MARIIFHIPYKIQTDHPSGTQIRPYKLLKAFENLNYQVDFVQGSAAERKSIIKSIKRNIENGIKYDFMYSESSSEPTPLTESHHLPTHPFLDYRFFAFCKRKQIPIGLFYRDIFWTFPFYGQGVPKWKKVIAQLFYKLDLIVYRKYLNVLFLPSLKMDKHIPIKFDCEKCPLPPASLFKDDIVKKAHQERSFKPLKIFYVGGISFLYRMHVLFEAVGKMDNVELTICSREEDWNLAKGEYESLLSENIKIIHEKDEGLLPYFNDAHLFSLFVEGHEYWEFVMALKLFEYLKHERPILTTKNTAVGEFVSSHDIGWNIEYDVEELTKLLESILKDPSGYNSKLNKMAGLLPDNTWESRVLTIASNLEKKKI